MKYIAPIVLFLIALPLVVIGTLFYMRRKRGQVAIPPQQGNAPVFANVPGTAAALGGTAVATATSVADTFASLKAITRQFVPDDSDYTPEPTIPADSGNYNWGSAQDSSTPAPSFAFWA